MGNHYSTFLAAEERKSSQGSSPTSSSTRSVRHSPSSTPMLPAKSTFASSRLPCALWASRSRTRSSRRWSWMSTTTATAPSFAEFLQMMTGKMGEKDTREDIEKVFKLFDDDN